MIVALRLKNTMQYYGKATVYNTKETYKHPTFSSIAGLIGAATGTPRDQLKNFSKLAVTVRIDKPGIVAYDYQTINKLPDYPYNHFNTKKKAQVQLVKANKAIDKLPMVTTRYYLEGASYMVFVKMNEQFMDLNKFKNPVFQLSCGRKSYPVATPFFMGTYENENIVSLFPSESTREHVVTHSFNQKVKGTPLSLPDELISTGTKYKYKERIVQTIRLRNPNFTRKEVLEWTKQNSF